MSKSFDRLSKAAAEMRASVAAPDANGWLPIETAPTDGPDILIASCFNGRWSVCQGHYVKRKKAWFSAGDWGDEEFSQPYRPTHWQHLPKPPVSAS